MVEKRALREEYLAPWISERNKIHRMKDLSVEQLRARLLARRTWILAGAPKKELAEDEKKPGEENHAY